MISSSPDSGAVHLLSAPWRVSMWGRPSTVAAAAGAEDLPRQAGGDISLTGHLVPALHVIYSEGCANAGDAAG